MQYRRRIIFTARRTVRRLGGQSAGKAGGRSCTHRVFSRLATGQSVLRLCHGKVTGRLPIYAYGMKVDGLTEFVNLFEFGRPFCILDNVS